MGIRAIKGINDLETTCPDLAKEWHPTKNGDLKPTDVTSGSDKKVWWYLPYDDPNTGKHFDFEWQASIGSRVRVAGCPYLSGHAVWVGYNDLQTTNPDLAKEWHPTKNGDLKPTDVTSGTDKNVWWYLPYDDPNTEKHFDFEWSAPVSRRLSGTGCPYLSGRAIWVGFNDLLTTNPDLAREWHPTLNDGLTPSDVTPGSNRKVYWRCPNCNYEWEAVVANRAKLGRGCPCCANKVVVKGINDLATTHPEIAKEWYQPLNGNVTPYDITYGCGKKYSWLCPRGHVYSATVLHRTNGGTECPVCNSGRQTSFAEQALYYYVKQVFPSAINSYKDIFTKGMELDIYIPEVKIGIEYDGVYWHHKKTETYEREQRKYDICKKNGIKLFRVREERKQENETLAADWSIFLATNDLQEAALNQAIEKVVERIVSETTGTRSVITDIPDIDTTRDRFAILAYLKGPVKYSVQEVAPELVKEWDYEKNGELKPDMIVGGSRQSVYWICSTCGYHWVAKIYHRVKNHTGCPMCAGFVLEKGVNDLKTKMPELLVDWDYEGNAKNNIFPNEIMFNSGKRVKWICHTCGHKWTISLNARTIQGDGCIKCGYKAGKTLKQKRLLEKQGPISDPLLLKEWDYDKNAELGLFPDQLTQGSGKSAYWICSKCGHKWKAPIARRNKGEGCRKCADKANPDLKRKTLIEKGHVLNDDLLIKEWDYDKNTKRPEDYTYGSNVKAYWICSKCGYSWSAAISSRHNGAGCPACAGNILVTGKNDLATMRPELAKEWDHQKNGDIDPSQVSYSSSKKCWWICPEGHDSYLATPSHRINGTGCPLCKNKKISEKLSKPVDQLSLDGTFIKMFNSVRAASEAINLSHGAINQAIRKGSTSGGYRWRYHIDSK